MAFQAGNFTASQLGAAILRADAMWADSMLKADFQSNTEIVTALRSEQNAKVDILQDKEKDRDVKIHWMQVCGQAVEDDDGDTCTIGGDEAGTDSKTYGLSIKKKWGFTVKEDTFRTNEYNMEDAVARLFLEGDKLLSEAIARSAVAKLDSFKGVNQAASGIGVVNGHETEIASADWGSRLFAYLYKVGILNNFGNSFLLSGDNLFEERIVTMANQANSNGSGDAKLYNLIRTYFDLFNIDTVLSPAQKTFLVNRGAVAFASKNKYGAVPVQYKEQDRYSIASRNIPGVRFDIYYTNECTEDDMAHHFTMRVWYDWFLNPLGCNADKTGVLSFKRVA